MLELAKRPLAKDDLKEIWRYTYENWGVQQADHYLYELDAAMQKLLVSPDLGRPRDALRAGYRSVHIGRHTVFYRVEGRSLEIVRVLHDSMDVERHL